jgi:outer membrane autotransporter protein
MIKHNMKPIFKYLCIPALITLPVSSACADDDTDLFINKVINIYQHPDRNLVITWTDDSNKSPSDGSPIRNADVSAKNITITSDFLGNRWTDKGIISEYSTNVNTSEDINITTNDDGVFTEGNGNININGFKNLNITSRAGFGVVDNGDGITITGGNNSVVSITSEEGNMGVPFWGQIWPIPNAAPAIGSSTRENNLGKGISISAGEIELNSTGNYSIQARYGKNGRFEVNLDASEIDITGTIYGAGGNITITPRTAGVMKISPSDKAEDETLKNNSILLTNGSTLTINKDSAELKQMQITGKINVAGEGTSLRANMTGDSSIKGSSSTVAIEASNGGSVELHMSGVNSSITGDVNAITGTGSSIFLNLSEAHQEGNLKAEGNNTLNAVYSGRNSSLTGTADNKGIMNLSFGNQSALSGDILNGVKVYEDNAFQSSFAGQLTANFDQSSWNGNLSNQGGTAGITLDRGSLWTGNLDNRGGTSGVTLSGGGTWTGNLSNQGGTADVTLHRGSVWTGKSSMSGADSVTNVSVNEGSTWKVTGDSSVSTLKLSGGKVDLGGLGIRMNIGHLSPGDGNPGTFQLDLTYHDNQRSTYENAGDSDFLYVGAGTGHSFRVEATENSSINGMRDRDKLYFARTARGVASFDVNQEVLIRNWDKIYNKALRVETETASVTSVKAKTNAPSLTVTGGSANTAASATSETDNQADTAAPASTADGAKAKTAAPLMAAASVRARVAAPMAVASAGESAAATSGTAASAEESTAASSGNGNASSENTTAASGDNDDVWYLTPEDTPLDNGFVPNANAYVPGSAHNAAASIWRDNDTLLKRLGELRWSKNNDGAWGRVINRNLSRGGTQAFDVSMNTLQLGYDRKIPLSFGDIFVGGAVEHSRGTEKYDDGDGSVYMTDGALYGTFKGRSGDYVDVVTKAGKLFTHYSSDFGDGGDFENWGFSASAEYGHKFDLGWSWSVEPQAQIKYSYLWGDDYTSDNGAKIYQDDTDSLVGRLGLLVAKEFGTDTENPVRIYAKGSVLHEFLGDRDETLYQDVAMHDSTDLAGTWYSAGIGANVGLSENCSFYVDAERDFGTDIKVQYRIQGGFRFEF